MFETVEQGGARFAGTETGYVYSRPANPSTNAVEEKIASLENGEAAMATASGMGAITATLYCSVVAGDEIVADETLYGCTFAFLSKEITQLGVKVSFINMNDIDALKAALTDKTRVVYFETPCNPTMKVIDIKAVGDAAHAFNKDIKVIVDNTFCSPYLQRPLDLGAGCCCSQRRPNYINGHGDVIAGLSSAACNSSIPGPRRRCRTYDRCGYEPVQRVPHRPRPQDAEHPHGSPLRECHEACKIPRGAPRRCESVLPRSGEL